jgi:hypothetical protein
MKKVFFATMIFIFSISSVSAQKIKQDLVYENAGIQQSFVHFIAGVQYNVTVSEYFANPMKNHVMVEKRKLPVNGSTILGNPETRFYALPPEVRNLRVEKHPEMLIITYVYRNEQKTIEIR